MLSDCHLSIAILIFFRTDAHDRAIHDALEKRHAELELIRYHSFVLYVVASKSNDTSR